MGEDKNQGASSDSADLSLTAIIKALDDGKPMPDAQGADAPDAFDPNATMNYQQAGASYPEFPFADEGNARAKTNPAQGQTQSQAASKQQAAGAIPLSETQRRASSPASGQARRPSAGGKSTSQNAGQVPRTPSAGATRAARRPLQTEGFDNPSSNFRPVNTQRSSYKIRGAGRKFNLRSPILIALCALLVVAGAGAMIFGVNNFFNSLSSTSNEAEISLTTAETREAIDGRIPVLVNYLDYGIEDATAVISESQFVYTNERYTPDSPDASAVNAELVSMPQEMTAEQMEGYYSGSYNAYTPEELAEYFNGSYVFDMARGEMGSWNKLRYVNLNATSIADEMAHLAELQGLTGETVTISDEGVDSRGNFVIQGQKVIDGERILYFKIAACPFKDLYTATALSDEGVYITCTLADYDFFTGADEITPAE